MYTEKRFYAKIVVGDYYNKKVVYYRSDMTSEQFMKWKWYFEYRAAKYKVDNPRKQVDLHTGNFDFVPTFKILEKRLKDDLKGAKSAYTKYNNKLQAAICKLEKQNSKSLFSKRIEDDPSWPQVKQKLEDLQAKVAKVEGQLSDLYNGRLEVPKSSYDCKMYGREKVSSYINIKNYIHHV